jgi:ketosteroid isomerase-like protein
MNWIKAAGVALLALSVLGGPTNAQQSSDVEAIKAANQAFYKALSARDFKAMQAVWANKPYVVNIGPRSKAVATGYDEAVTKYWDNALFNNVFSKIEAQITSVTQAQTDGKIAWVSGLEKATLHLKSGGDPLNIENFVTNVYEKDGDHWLMVLHHAQVIPK